MKWSITKMEELKFLVIKDLQDGMTRPQVCIKYDCTYAVLWYSLKRWGVIHLKNQGRKHLPRKKFRKFVDYEDGTFATNARLKLLLWDEGLKKKECEICGWDKVSGTGHFVLELHHVDGNNRNNKLENLKILCPNCHALEPNNSGASAKRGRVVNRE